MKAREKYSLASEFSDKKRRGQNGFTLVEVTIAMLILLIVLLGVFVTFTYAVNYNAGNNSRAQALSVLQQQVELLRSAKFTPTVTDDGTKPFDLTGGKKAEKSIQSADGSRFKVAVTVDDDPFDPGVQTNSAKTIKEITIQVSLDSPTPGWQTSLPAIVILRRVRGN